MTNIINKEYEIFYCKKQAEVYKILADSLLKARGTISKFGGKVLNVRLQRAMREAIANNNIIVYTELPRLIVRYRHTFKYNEHSNLFVEYDSISIRIVTNSNNRIDSNCMLDELDNAVDELNKMHDELINSVENFDKIEEEYNKICDSIKEFNSKYPYSIRKRLNFNRVY